MKVFLEIVQTWSGIVLLLVLAVIGIICSLAGSTSGEERRLDGQDDDHYVLRLPIGRVLYPLILLIAGIALEFICDLLPIPYLQDQPWLMMVVKLAIGAVFGLLFWTQLAKVLRRRVFVNGDKIIVTPAIGSSIETNFKQIRTVANIHAGKDRGVIGKKIRTKEGNRFEVINTMPGYDHFCEQLNEKMELPNLAKKLFKKRDKKASTEPEPEDVVSQDPLPQASPVSAVPEAPVSVLPEASAEVPEEVSGGILPEVPAEPFPGADASSDVSPVLTEAAEDVPGYMPETDSPDTEFPAPTKDVADSPEAEETGITEDIPKDEDL